MNKRETIDALRRLMRDQEYDPVRGIGACGCRVEAPSPVSGYDTAFIPQAMTQDALYPTVTGQAAAWERLRIRYDFEFWAARCVVVKDKTSARDIPFVLNPPQRRVLDILEQDRRADQPIRLILLKARQWGGSTLVQMYMAWIQCVHRSNWHSLICAHVKDTSASIRGMYSKMLEHYPADLWDGDDKPRLKPFERSVNLREIAGRQCRIAVGSSEKPDALRGSDYAMAHLSETAFWTSTPRRSPRDLIQSVCGGIGLNPCTLVAIESTANGQGDFFHTEWLRCKAGLGDKHAVFVPWSEIPMYRLDGADATGVLDALDPYEEQMWEHGCCADQILWRRRKMREFENISQMNAEFPIDDREAFNSSQNEVFNNTAVELMRENCNAPSQQGEIGLESLRFEPDALQGRFVRWEAPLKNMRYAVAVDIGGRSASSDWSVIAVMKEDSPRPAVVAQWRGHCDHDILAAKAEAIARHYNNALLIIESNTLETQAHGSPQEFILNRLKDRYRYLYMRTSMDSISGTRSTKVGFHTNRKTKEILINELIGAVRNQAYIERDNEACNELLSYRQLHNGAYAAKDGCHDDILMTRALALHALKSGQMPSRPDSSLPEIQRW